MSSYKAFAQSLMRGEVHAGSKLYEHITGGVAYPQLVRNGEKLGIKRVTSYNLNRREYVYLMARCRNLVPNNMQVLTEAKVLEIVIDLETRFK